jgi:GNAT superfamily N-acetyltransferase
VTATSFTIREARAGDGDAIASVQRTSKQDALPYLPDLHTAEEDRWWVANVLLPSQTVWVAEVDGEIVGMVSVSEGFVQQLYVLPGYQGLGIGSTLLEKAIELSPNGLELWAFQQNERARGFYERRGFVAVEFTDGANNEERTPDVRYRLMPRD